MAELLNADFLGANFLGNVPLEVDLRDAELLDAELLDAELLYADLLDANVLDSDLLDTNFDSVVDNFSSSTFPFARLAYSGILAGHGSKMALLFLVPFPGQSGSSSSLSRSKETFSLIFDPSSFSSLFLLRGTLWCQNLTS